MQVLQLLHEITELGTPEARTCWRPTTSAAPCTRPFLADPRRPANAARFIYLNPAARAFFANWDTAAFDTAPLLRREADRNPYDKDAGFEPTTP